MGSGGIALPNLKRGARQGWLAVAGYSRLKG